MKKYLNFIGGVLFCGLLMTSCGEDEPENMEQDKDCKLEDVYLDLDETSRFGLMSIEYDESGSIVSSGIQSHIYTYDADGNVISSLLMEDVGVPRVETTFTYENNKLVKAEQIWGNDLEADPRYVYDLVYDGEYLDEVNTSGTLGSGVLDFDFDENGNILKYADWVFGDVTEFTYIDSEMGLFQTPLSHNNALAYSICTLQPYYFWNNAPETQTESGTTLTFDNEYSDQNLLVKAYTEDEDVQLSFDYKCE